MIHVPKMTKSMRDPRPGEWETDTRIYSGKGYVWFRTDTVLLRMSGDQAVSIGNALLEHGNSIST